MGAAFFSSLLMSIISDFCFVSSKRAYPSKPEPLETWRPPGEAILPLEVQAESELGG